MAMSGGVDSSVAAALLKKEGYSVVGVFMKNWSEDIPSGFCTSEQDFADVRAVCQHLDIPYYTFNFEKEYKKRVLDYFFAEYKAGRTPNPDVMCNKEIKFDLFLKKCASLGADFIATGHYARRVELRPKRNPEDRSVALAKDGTVNYQLLKGNDPIKDQTYFLYNLTQDQLSKTLFPVGKYPKSKVRALAKKFKLPTANKKDSQGICFIGQIDVKEFLKTVIKPKKGKIVNQEGKMLGSHEGAWFYTIGQRRIEGLAGQPKPLYVIATDIKKNLVIVGPDSATYAKGVVLEDFHLIGEVASRESRVASGKNKKSSFYNLEDHPVALAKGGSTYHLSPITCHYLSAKPRYGPEVYKGRLVAEQVASRESRDSSTQTAVIPASEPESRQKNKQKNAPTRHSSLVTRHSFIFNNPQRALTPGQSLVIYDKQTCLGGGVIKTVIKK